MGKRRFKVRRFRPAYEQVGLREMAADKVPGVWAGAAMSQLREDATVVVPSRLAEQGITVGSSQQCADQNPTAQGESPPRQ